VNGNEVSGRGQVKGLIPLPAFNLPLIGPWRDPIRSGRVTRNPPRVTRNDDEALDRGRKKEDGAGMNHMRRGSRSFTLVEILVVVSIIGLLAGLAIPAVGGALSSAKRAKVTSMANQIRVAVNQFYTEYGFYPTNRDFDQQGVGRTTAEFSLILIGDSNNSVALSQNPRRLAFLEVPNDFTSNNTVVTRGILTPVGYFKGSARSNFSVSVDHNYDGVVRVTNNGVGTNYNATVHVWFPDNRDTRKTVGTWR